MAINIPALLDRLSFRYPARLVDRVIEHEPGRRLVAIKNVTGSEDYFLGHFPGAPVMPGVLIVETLVQGAAVLLLDRGDAAPDASVTLRGVNDARFRRQVVPGDQVRFELEVGRGRGPIVRVRGVASVGDQVVAEAELVLHVRRDRVRIDPTANVHPGAVVGDGTVIGPHAVIGEHVRIGAQCEVGASAVIDGWTEIGQRNRIAPSVSIGLAPQDLKYAGEQTRLVIGDQNVIREFVTVHRGTAGGGGVTRIGHRNVLMAYVHVAHDCQIGNDVIFGNAVTLGGHVRVGDFANISAFSGVHQFCTIGPHAFIGGYSVITKDALPYARTVGARPARIFGLNTIGLVRRGFSPDVVAKLKQAFRYLLVSHLTLSAALDRIESDPALECGEVRTLVSFIRGSRRGVILRRRATVGEEE